VQFKRALVRSMDDRSCLETKVTELANMLDLATSISPGKGPRSPDGGTAQSRGSSESSGTPKSGDAGALGEEFSGDGEEAVLAAQDDGGGGAGVRGESGDGHGVPAGDGMVDGVFRCEDEAF